MALAPDLLGFRGALCHGGDRTEALDAGRLAAIRALIPERPRILRSEPEPKSGRFSDKIMLKRRYDLT